MSSAPEKRFKPEPVETTVRTSRRFAPQPVETTARSSRQTPAGSEEKPVRRRFAPQPIETSTSSSKDKSARDDDTVHETKAPKSRFRPQLVEESVQQRRRDARDAEISTPDPQPPQQVDAASAAPRATSNSMTRRKFTPMLLDTATRSRRAGDQKPAVLPGDKTDAPPTAQIPIKSIVSLSAAAPRQATRSRSLSPELSAREARRLGIPLPPRQISLEPSRTHSFRLPDLDTIESSESEQSEASTSPSSPSASSTSLSLDKSKRRAGHDEEPSGYLLEIAARAAERELREQALAAFPNDDRHTPVDHFVDSDEYSVLPSRADTEFRRDSGVMNTDLQYLEMQRYQAKRLAQKEKEKQEREARRKRIPQLDKSPWANPFMQGSPKKNELGGGQADRELERMRKQARPPMLGRDLKFPRCQSPDAARFDVTQGAINPEELLQRTESNESLKPREGLWCSASKASKDCLSPGSRPGSHSPSSPSLIGLWGGFCRESSGCGISRPGPTGLLTPRIELEEKQMDFTSGQHLQRQLPPSPPPSTCGTNTLDEKLELEQALEEEFSDAFVTQVYNYLSLGYPSLARKYDDELGKIARVPVSDLRQDDHLPTSRGYIRLGEDEAAKGDHIAEDQCLRWRALRLYIHEWARQQPYMSPPENTQGGGVTVRRGSWAW